MSSLLWMLLKQGTGKERGERGRSGGLRRSAGSGEGARGAEKERGEGEIDKWEASRELEMKLLIELGLS